jgi:ferredoxin
MREQVCIYMCPWPRIQAALTDEWALNVTYKYDRGEPRMSVKKAAEARAHGEPAGDCIDCYQCVNVCPTGVDIRDGIAARLHPVRPVHRRLRHRHGQDRPAEGADRLRHRRQHSIAGAPASRRSIRLVRARTIFYAPSSPSSAASCCMRSPRAR